MNKAKFYDKLTNMITKNPNKNVFVYESMPADDGINDGFACAFVHIDGSLYFVKDCQFDEDGDIALPPSTKRYYKVELSEAGDLVYKFFVKKHNENDLSFEDDDFDLIDIDAKKAE